MKITVRQLKSLIREAVEEAMEQQLPSKEEFLKALEDAMAKNPEAAAAIAAQDPKEIEAKLELLQKKAGQAGQAGQLEEGFWDAKGTKNAINIAKMAAPSIAAAGGLGAALGALIGYLAQPGFGQHDVAINAAILGAYAVGIFSKPIIAQKIGEIAGRQAFVRQRAWRHEFDRRRGRIPADKPRVQKSDLMESIKQAVAEALANTPVR